ncbi:reverse transcriptase domain, reverse transcriptase zinc-binding domain protein [Tanacetum coccineum]
MAGLEGVLEHGTWLIHNVLFILRKWTLRSMLTKEELTYVPVWIKFHGVPVSAFTTNGLSVIATLPNLIENGVTMHTIKVEYEWKPSRCETCLVFGHEDMRCPKHGMVDLRKQGGMSNDGFQTIQKKDFHGPFGSKQGTEYNAEPLDDFVDDTWKKMDAPPRKTPRKIGIWLGRKANSPKRNIVFSPKRKVHYLGREDMEFDDMGQAVEEVEHENAYSKNG